MNYKFRGKRVDNGEWAYGQMVIAVPFFESGNNASPAMVLIASNVMHNVGSDFNIDYDEVDPLTLSQWSGLCDRTGKELYADDAIELFGHVKKVVYRNGAFGYCLSEHGFFPFASHSHIKIVDGRITNVRIAGNVHDNAFKDVI